jgi:hypothetical protein
LREWPWRPRAIVREPSVIREPGRQREFEYSATISLVARLRAST